MNKKQTMKLFVVGFLMFVFAAVPATEAFALTKSEFKSVLCDDLQGPGAKEACYKQADGSGVVMTRACSEGEAGCEGGIKSRTVKFSDWKGRTKAALEDFKQTWMNAGSQAAQQTSSSNAPGKCSDISTNIITCGTKGGNPIMDIALQAINFLAVGVGIAVVGGITWGGMMYASSNGDSAKTKQAITIIVNAVVGLLLFIFMYAFINFLVPGGLFT